jgi:GTP pyrophosphokinase
VAVGATTVLSEVIPGWDVAGEGARERLDPDLLARAYRYSERAHEGQTRSSGDPYVVHCVEVAKILAELQLDSVTVAAGLIHDVVEDTSLTVADVEQEFGAEVAQIVDGLTKIGNLPMHSKEERQVENYRKLLLSVAKDARVILIKLADRLHNMRTLDYLAPEKRRRIAQETRDLYAPLAHRFGMARVRWELEDLAFKHLEPEEYRALAKLVATKRGEREALIAQLREPLERQLRAAGIDVSEVTGRPKHLWSIYKKMKQRDRPYEDIYDLLAIRVLVGTVPECYHALGVIHEWWTPLQERIKDYIAQPKSNGYQSLHTTVFGPGKQLFEVQIRTRQMHRTADYGIAAHWRYKENSTADDLDRQLAWFRQVLELQLDATDPGEFLEFLKLDLYQDEIFVFTPTGDVIQLPKGATPIDFAFAVHTQVGLHCAGAKVNGRIAPLARQLKNSETVEILTAPVAKPSRDWLAHVHTSRARHKIRQWLRQEEQKTAGTVGREIPLRGMIGRETAIRLRCGVVGHHPAARSPLGLTHRRGIGRLRRDRVHVGRGEAPPLRAGAFRGQLPRTSRPVGRAVEAGRRLIGRGRRAVQIVLGSRLVHATSSEHSGIGDQVRYPPPSSPHSPKHGVVKFGYTTACTGGGSAEKVIADPANITRHVGKSTVGVVAVILRTKISIAFSYFHLRILQQLGSTCPAGVAASVPG